MQTLNDDIFYDKDEVVSFDNLIVDVANVYATFPIGKKEDTNPKSDYFVRSPFHKVYRCCLLPLLYRRYFWRIARQVNLDLTWFQEFRSYWTLVLGGRSLGDVYDLFFLKSFYRIKFKKSQVPDSGEAAIHLMAWQRPEVVLYHLLQSVVKEATSDQLYILQQFFKYKKNAQVLLEFGCATAPITTSLFEFYQPKKDLKVYISDIQTLAFHYASYKFRHRSNVHPLLLLPENDFLPVLDDRVDAIFCMTVFEHLNKPLEIIKIFHQVLNRGGLLFFDYIKSDGEGMDTLHGVRERGAVLDFVSEHFEILHGILLKDKSIGLTIARKR